MQLVRNCAHGSDVAALLKCVRSDEMYMIKASTTANGIKDLESEYAGWNWYKEVLAAGGDDISCECAVRLPSYLRIQIRFLHGSKGIYQEGLVQNAAIIDGAIDQYLDIWPSDGGLTHLHGDLSIDNILLTKNGPRILDWEHFRKNSATWGFDALYLLFESLWFSLGEGVDMTMQEKMLIVSNLKKLDRTGKLKGGILEAPLAFTRLFIKENLELWGSQIEKYPNKLAVLIYSDRQVETIDSAIRGAW